MVKTDVLGVKRGQLGAALRMFYCFEVLINWFRCVIFTLDQNPAGVLYSMCLKKMVLMNIQGSAVAYCHSFRHSSSLRTLTSYCCTMDKMDNDCNLHELDLHF